MQNQRNFSEQAVFKGIEGGRMSVVIAVWVLGSFPLGLFLGLVIRLSRRRGFPEDTHPSGRRA
jgi:hypothetical protein